MKTRQLTIAELIDYLSQFNGFASVYLTTDDTANEADDDFIVLEDIGFIVTEDE